MTLTKIKYEKISKEDVYEVLARQSITLTTHIDIINIVNMARSLNTSRYQVKKYINELVKEGKAELGFIKEVDEYEQYPPYWGYGLTERGRDTEKYKEMEKEHRAILKRIFDI